MDPTHLQAHLRTLCHEYIDIFTEFVRPTAALVEPLRLTVDPNLWHLPKNRAPVRLQTNSKNEEITRQIEKMLDLGVIESESILASTPGTQARTQHVALLHRLRQTQRSDQGSGGLATSQYPRMLERVGMMDLTAGYHQTPVHPDSMIYTAFTCFLGLFTCFQWN